ncbi:SUMO-activating enzyme subunitB-1 [Sesamum angolense]|uniref:Ubiquitin-like 1-activating enzyme E1A n=1 Tax=Sesamum angolense TaxID=2727404 RepID=A0AAE1WLK9_9LAMI|nr:SUMO-activating enzyme subunitB-1 [Sesamum angolense]
MSRNWEEDNQNPGLKVLLGSAEEAGEKYVFARKQQLLHMFLRLQLDMDGEELTEQETALYDRQIRVWGADAQRRLSKSHILVSGLKGTVVEFCKNIVLAGVGSVTLNDDRLVTEELLSANFLVPPDENVYSGKSLAELCCDSLTDFNPMVRVSVEKGEVSKFSADFFDKFDVVVISSCSLSTKQSINEKCRKSLKRIAFYTVDCRDSCGEIFVDLQNYIYTKKKNDEAVECLLEYSSFEVLEYSTEDNLLQTSIVLSDEKYGARENEMKEVCFVENRRSCLTSTQLGNLMYRNRAQPYIHWEAVSVPWRSLPRRVSKLYLAMRVIEKFEELEGRIPGETSAADLPNVQKLRKELCEAQSLDESQIPDSLLERLLEGRREFPPVCAVIGGILGQEVIKAISGKGDPLKNFFFFDAMDGKGIIEDIFRQKS